MKSFQTTRHWLNNSNCDGGGDGVTNVKFIDNLRLQRKEKPISKRDTNRLCCLMFNSYRHREQFHDHFIHSSFHFSFDRFQRIKCVALQCADLLTNYWKNIPLNILNRSHFSNAIQFYYRRKKY